MDAGRKRLIIDIVRDIPNILLSLAILAGLVAAELGLAYFVASFVT